MRGLLLAASITLASALSVQAKAEIITVSVESGVQNANLIPEYGSTLAPLSFVKFCMGNATECETRAGRHGEADLSIADLVAVNRQVNASISPMRKPTEPLKSNWAVGPAAGDCNDYAVTKRSRLISAGWPSEKLRLAVVLTPQGTGHLVLVARTAQGDLVLDNLSAQVKPWNDTKYDWVSMQSAENPRFWVAVGEQGRQLRQRFQTLAANLH